MQDRLTKQRSASNQTLKRKFISGKGIVLENGEVIKHWQYREGECKEMYETKAAERRNDYAKLKLKKKQEKKSTHAKLEDSETENKRLAELNSDLERANSELAAELAEAKRLIEESAVSSTEPIRMELDETNSAKDNTRKTRPKRRR